MWSNKLKEDFLDKGTFKLKLGDLVKASQGRQRGGNGDASGYRHSIIKLWR